MASDPTNQRPTLAATGVLAASIAFTLVVVACGGGERASIGDTLEFDQVSVTLIEVKADQFETTFLFSVEQSVDSTSQFATIVDQSRLTIEGTADSPPRVAGIQRAPGERYLSIVSGPILADSDTVTIIMGRLILEPVFSWSTAEKHVAFGEWSFEYRPEG